jgi:alpha-beta hydrolase superfamily lysophospholipase
MIKKELLSVLGFFSAIYVIICWHLYMSQEGMIFFPQKLNKSYKFNFDQNFDEIKIKMRDGITIDGVLFKAKYSRWLIFYLHGNAGSIDVWGKVAKTYTDLNYDVFLLDYRGYGKSEGEINGEQGLFEDVQDVYGEIKKRYSEDKINCIRLLLLVLD